MPKDAKCKVIVPAYDSLIEVWNVGCLDDKSTDSDDDNNTNKPKGIQKKGQATKPTKAKSGPKKTEKQNSAHTQPGKTKDRPKRTEKKGKADNEPSTGTPFLPDDYVSGSSLDARLRELEKNLQKTLGQVLEQEKIKKAKKDSEEQAIIKVESKVDSLLRDLKASMTKAAATRAETTALFQTNQGKVKKYVGELSSRVETKLAVVDTVVTNLSTQFSEKVTELKNTVDATHSTVDSKFAHLENVVDQRISEIRDDTRDMKQLLLGCVQDKNAMLAWLMSQMAQTQSRLLGTSPVSVPSLTHVYDNGVQGAGQLFSLPSFGCQTGGARSSTPVAGNVA
jgi:hypothetical protein